MEGVMLIFWKILIACLTILIAVMTLENQFNATLLFNKVISVVTLPLRCSSNIQVVKEFNFVVQIQGLILLK